MHVERRTVVDNYTLFNGPLAWGYGAFKAANFGIGRKPLTEFVLVLAALCKRRSSLHGPPVGIRPR